MNSVEKARWATFAAYIKLRICIAQRKWTAAYAAVDDLKSAEFELLLAQEEAK
jgi:hypothetical protein